MAGVERGAGVRAVLGVRASERAVDESRRDSASSGGRVAAGGEEGGGRVARAQPHLVKSGGPRRMGRPSRRQPAKTTFCCLAR